MDDPVEPTVLAAADGLRVLGNYPGANATDAAVDGDRVTPESCRRLGRAVGRAIRQFDVRER